MGKNKKKLKKMILKNTTTYSSTTPLPKDGFFGTTNSGYRIKPLPRKKKVENRPKDKFVKNLIREVAGLKPYELRVIDLLNGTGGKVEKKARKFAKKRLGEFGKAKKKVVEMGEVIKEGLK